MAVIIQGATSDLMLSLVNELFFFPKWKGFQNLLVSQKCNFLNLDFWCSCNSKVGWQHLREMGFYSLLPLCARQAGGGDCGQAGSAVR